MDSETLMNLEDNLLLFFTGYTRSASDILRDQDCRSKQKDSGMTANLDLVKQLGYESKEALEKGDLRRFAELMHVHWEIKKKRSANISNPHINELYDLGRQNGALGGKLIGAGGGGFLMFYSEDKTRLRCAMRNTGLREVRVRFDLAGTTVLAHS
jgi:D-glycero-alpha-D-manno-heptose-7-phosphate kinase